MNRAFDFPVVNPREKPIAGDINMLTAASNLTLRDLLERLFAQRQQDGGYAGQASSGFFGESFFVVPPSDPVANTVEMLAGIGLHYRPSGVEPPRKAVTDVEGLNDLSTTQPLVLSANQRITCDPPPGAGFTRIDNLEVRATRLVTDPSQRLVFNEPIGDFLPGQQNKTLTYDLRERVFRTVPPAQPTTPISYTVGVPNVTGNEQAPPVSDGYIKIAEIRVRNLVDNPGGFIQPEDIADFRRILFDGGTCRINAAFSVDTTVGPAIPVPQLLSVVAPPGVRFSFISTGGPGAIVAMGVVAGAQMAATLQVGAGTPPFNAQEFYQANSSVVVSGVIAAASGIFNVASAAPAHRISPRQFASIAQFQALRCIPAGFTLVNGTPLVLTYTVGFTGRYI